MPRRSPAAPESAAGPSVPIVADGAYSVEAVRQALGLRKTTLAREMREGRLRYSIVAGRRVLLGRSVLEWIARGEVRKEKADHSAA
jgi:hypothetical protein